MTLPDVSAPREQPRAVVPQRQIRAALRAGELELHYQPIVDVATGRSRGAEALLRWCYQPGALLMPDDFLPAVAHTPVMHELTSWVLDEACAQAARWRLPSVSVNVAAVDVVRPALVATVADTLRRHGLAAGRLVVELTEHAAVQGMRAAADVLRELRALGVGVSLDDFGTGYSSLLYLRDLPVTEVKVDRTFVEGVDRTEDDAAIVGSVTQLAHAVGLKVVAEGVETPSQLEFLRDAGCDFVQGYLLGRPAAPSTRPPVVEPVTGLGGGPAGDQSRRTTAPRRRRRGRLEPVSEQVDATISALVAEGASLHTIAAALNREGLVTPTGTRWSAATVAHALRDQPPGRTA